MAVVQMDPSISDASLQSRISVSQNLPHGTEDEITVAQRIATDNSDDDISKVFQAPTSDQWGHEKAQLEKLSNVETENHTTVTGIEIQPW